MKDITVIYPRDNKPFIKKLIGKIETDGISCWVGPRDFKQEDREALENTILQSKLLVIIIGKASAANIELRQALTIALNNNIEIIPLVIEKIEPNLYIDFFLNRLSWIDAVDDSFENAYELLLETYRDLTGEKKIDKKRNVKKNNAQSKAKPLTIGIALVVVLIVAFIVYKVIKTDANSEFLVGQWIVSDYQDNLPGHNQDSLNLIKNYLKTSARLIFNDNHGFERRGFSAVPQVGKWELNPERTILYLKADSTEKNDIVNIEKLTKTELVIFVDENQDNSKVSTKISFTKQPD